MLRKTLPASKGQWDDAVVFNSLPKCSSVTGKEGEAKAISLWERRTIADITQGIEPYAANREIASALIPVFPADVMLKNDVLLLCIIS